MTRRASSGGGLRCNGGPQTGVVTSEEDGRTTRHFMSASEFGGLGPLGPQIGPGPPTPVGPTEMVRAAAAAIAAAPNAVTEPTTHHTMTAAIKTEVVDAGNMTAAVVTADVGPSQIMDNVTGTPFSFTQCKPEKFREKM